MDLAQRLEKAKRDGHALREKIRKNRDLAKDATLPQVAQHIPPITKLSMKCRRLLKGHVAKIYSLSWANDSTRLVSASQDGKLIVWNALTTNKEAIMPLRSPWVMSCAFSPSGNLVACGGLENLVTVFNLRSPAITIRPCRELAAHQGYIPSLCFVDDRRILSSSGDCTCILWDIETRRVLQRYHEHICDVMDVSVAPDRTSFVSGACDATAKVWDMRTGRAVQTFTGHHSDINSVKFFPNGMAFGTGSDDGSCRLFDIRADRQLMQYTDNTMFCAVSSVDFSRSGRVLFGACDDWHVYAWDVLRGTRITSLAEHGNRVSCLEVTADGNTLATGSWDTYLRIWA
eukprot:gnl/Dysnectes_brevis/1747_a1994_1626.p1 GENE.gnl/Dysnectes_brevis/1747_a1994_1626~~gnl/Dysnectes_brevis/1747_a1994_1626.p1  ORF type:complete len:344 (-),score=67.64 gnl/Dysnectes_brevis/1747_a1994_1626:153-1184(-)